MPRFMFAMAIAMAALAVVAEAQQPVRQAQQPVRQAQQSVRQAAPRPTRSYRSYSVTPAPRGDVSAGSRHAAEATWRHAGAKPVGHYGGGR
jgi:hypothetical protein